MMFKTCASLAVLSAHVDALKANMMTKNNKVESNLPTLLTSKPKNQGTNTAPNSGNGNLLKNSDVKTKVPTKTTAKTGTTKPTTKTGTPTKTTAKTDTTKTDTTTAAKEKAANSESPGPADTTTAKSSAVTTTGKTGCPGVPFTHMGELRTGSTAAPEEPEKQDQLKPYPKETGWHKLCGYTLVPYVELYDPVKKDWVPKPETKATSKTPTETTGPTPVKTHTKPTATGTVEPYELTSMVPTGPTVPTGPKVTLKTNDKATLKTPTETTVPTVKPETKATSKTPTTGTTTVMKKPNAITKSAAKSPPPEELKEITARDIFGFIAFIVVLSMIGLYGWSIWKVHTTPYARNSGDGVALFAVLYCMAISFMLFFMLLSPPSLSPPSGGGK